MSENRLEIVLQEYKKLCAKFKQPTRSRIINGLEDAIKSGKTQIDAFNLSTPGLKDIKKLYDKDVVAFLEAVKHSENQDLFLGLDLSWNRLKDVGAKCIANYLEGNKWITTLNIQGNDITSEGGKEICQKLLAQSEKDQTLDEPCSNLEILNLNSNNIEDETIMLLSKFLLQTKKLHTLDIGNCDFTHKGWMHIMINLQKNQTLKTLNIENCRIITLSHEMSVVFAKLLEYNKTLENLNLSRQGDGVGDDGMEWISKYLVNNHSLKYLDLSCNRLSCDGIKSICNVMSCNQCSIESLILKGNRLTDLSAKYICQIIDQSESIKYIDLQACSFSDSGLNLIAETLDSIADQISTNQGNVHVHKIQTILLDKNAFGYKSSQMWKTVIQKFKNIEQNNSNSSFVFDFWPLIQQ